MAALMAQEGLTRGEEKLFDFRGSYSSLYKGEKEFSSSISFLCEAEELSSYVSFSYKGEEEPYSRPYKGQESSSSISFLYEAEGPISDTSVSYEGEEDITSCATVAKFLDYSSPSSTVFSPYLPLIEEFGPSVGPSEEFDILTIPNLEKVRQFRARRYEHYGLVYEIRIEGSAREAMESWLQAIDKSRAKGIKIPIFYEWTGELDLSPEELGRFVAEAMLKMDLPLATKEPFDAVSLVREERE